MDAEHVGPVLERIFSSWLLTATRQPLPNSRTGLHTEKLVIVGPALSARSY
jgi:hypothetical protein